MLSKRILCLGLFYHLAIPVMCLSEDAAAIIAKAIDYYRGSSSQTTADMTINRPEWQRKMSIKSWTLGRKKSLVRFTAPPRDAGNASLTDDNQMWSFSPKINKVIKIPPSMMAQSWMGSDFSYQDLAKTDDLIKNYKHRLIETEEKDSFEVYTIESIPLEDAPVVWGKEVVKIRQDFIILEHAFYDQDMRLVKKLTTSEIEMIGGKLYPRKIRMQKADQPDEWTEVFTREAEFGQKIPARTFTLSYLRNPRG